MVSFLFLVAVHFAFGMGPVYAVGVCIIGALYVMEHRLVSPDDLCRIDIAFFHVNSIVSVTLFLAVLCDELMRRWG
jgi:4-hydroxybenzoate polyprenyltransferase